jgi:two-component system, NarL family, nitrate/nitrite response regulator NarL
LKTAMADEARLGKASAMAGKGAEGKKPLACVLADDHEDMLSSLTSLLEAEGFTVVGAATTAHAAIQLLEAHKPDLAVVDFRLGDMTGVEVAREAARLGLATRIVIHTAETGAALVREALAAGVLGLAGKAVPPAPLLQALAAAAEREVYVDPALGSSQPDSVQ